MWPYQRGIADAIGDPAIERVSAGQGGASRVHHALNRRDRQPIVANEPVADPTRCFQPRPTRGTMWFRTSNRFSPPRPALRGALSAMTSRKAKGTRCYTAVSPAARSSVSPRGRRATFAATPHACSSSTRPTRCETGAEGNPLRLAERRTLQLRQPENYHRLARPCSKIRAHVLRAYGESDHAGVRMPLSRVRGAHRDPVGA